MAIPPALVFMYTIILCYEHLILSICSYVKCVARSTLRMFAVIFMYTWIVEVIQCIIVFYILHTEMEERLGGYQYQRVVKMYIGIL